MTALRLESMTELHEAIDKLFAQVDHLDHVLGDADELNEEQVILALSVAKRVMRQSNLTVRALARLRDQLQPRRAQAHE
jgi:hypothetical protein